MVTRIAGQYHGLGHDVVLVWVDVNNETMKARIHQRNSPRDTSKMDDWEEYIATIEREKYIKQADFVINNNLDGLELCQIRFDIMTLVSKVIIL